jgi:hypothetical protein
LTLEQKDEEEEKKNSFVRKSECKKASLRLDFSDKKGPMKN